MDHGRLHRHLHAPLLKKLIFLMRRLWIEVTHQPILDTGGGATAGSYTAIQYEVSYRQELAEWLAKT